MVVTENFQREVTLFLFGFWKDGKKTGLLDNIQYRVCEAAVHYHNEVQGMTKIWYITVLSLSIIQSSSKETQNYLKKTAKKSKTDYKFSPKTQKETKKCLQTTTQCTKWLANNKDTKFIKVKAKPLQRQQTTDNQRNNNTNSLTCGLRFEVAVCFFKFESLYRTGSFTSLCQGLIISHLVFGWAQKAAQHLFGLWALIQKILLLELISF